MYQVHSIFVLLFILFHRISADGIFEINLTQSNHFDKDAEGNCCDGPSPFSPSSSLSSLLTSSSSASSPSSSAFSSSSLSPVLSGFSSVSSSSSASSSQSNQTKRIITVPKCRYKCNPSYRICLRHYERTINLNGDCSYGEVIVPPNKASETHQIKFSFSWPREFSLIIESFHTAGSGRYPVKRQLFRRSFQESIEVSPDWKVEPIRTNHTTVVARLRVLCDRDFYGKDCSQSCVPRNDNTGHFECTDKGKKCLSGWQGEFCDVPICAEGCRNGTCKIPGTCECLDGFEGVLCDKCKVYPGCSHGTCKKPWECNCEDGWGGTFCDKDLNYCTHHRPCVNGLCFNTGLGSYTCECILGFTGRDCDIPVSDCSTSPCLNGGTCSQSSPDSNYTCECPSNFIGPNCEKLKSTACSPGWQGEFCDIPICAEGCNGTCKSPGTCECSDGYEGLLCDKCKVFPGCQHGTCNKPWECNCEDGWGGSLCEKGLNDCTRHNPCVNGVCSITELGSYTCECVYGFTGVKCDIPIIDCASSPCRNGGTCSQSSASSNFTCDCPMGFTGHYCETKSPIIVNSGHHSVPVPIFIRSEGEGHEYLSKSQTAMISVVLCIIPFVLLCILSVKLIKRRIRAQERQRYENEEAIRQNVENSSKKCLQNDSCLIYNDLNRDSMRFQGHEIPHQQHHYHIPHSLLVPSINVHTSSPDSFGKQIKKV